MSPDVFIDRPQQVRRIVSSFRVHPAVALIGPRQCGKTTLAQLIGAKEREVEFFDLESASDLRRLQAPEQALTPLSGLLVIDEIQRRQQLFETLRVLLDRRNSATRFLLPDGASRSLARGACETLAGRIGLVDLSGFDPSEISGGEKHDRWADRQRLWRRGGFPRSYLAPDDPASALRRESFVGTFLERDIPQFGITIPAESLRRFWTMLAHYHGQIWNAAEFARAIGSGQATARRYLDILGDAPVVRVLPP